MKALLCLLPMCLIGCNPLSHSEFSIKKTRGAIVKIHSTIQRPSYLEPWRISRPENASGTGFLIKGKKIITNAHVISDSRNIQVQKDADSRMYPAHVLAVGHDCDLAVIEVEDDSFYNDMSPLPLATQLPDLNSEVTVLGFPIGGTRLSITKGVVSRIDYGVYAHSGADMHLVIQVDAAINPGNSGGPVFYNDKVVGVAFQGLFFGENIGYIIPIPVLQHFLTDIEDGRYDGYPELGIFFFEARNNGLAKKLSLPTDMEGVVIYKVDPFGSANGLLFPNDILLAIDGYPILDDGTVILNGNNLEFHEVIEQKQAGAEVVFDIWRNNKKISVKVPLIVPKDPFIYRIPYDTHPKMLVHGGLVFCPLSKGHLMEISHTRNVDPNVYKLFYYAEFVKFFGLYKQFDEIVFLSSILPHSVNYFCEKFKYGIVTQVNNYAVRNLEDIKNALKQPVSNYHIMRFAGLNDFLIIDANASEKANEEIAAEYNIWTYDK